MTHPRFFGYGSLVNCATHTYPDPRPETLHGWRRQWVKTEGREVVYLSARPDPDSAIDGLTAQVPDADWSALDLRESGYARLPLDPRTSIYAVPDERHLPVGTHVILRSYLDVVIQGFLQRFGEPGVARFFDTTDGWDTPVLDDRAAPRYPRHLVLTPAETALVDRHLTRVTQS